MKEATVKLIIKEFDKAQDAPSSDSSYLGLEIRVRKILELINELTKTSDSEDFKMKCQIAYSDLSYTLREDVSQAENSFRKDKTKFMEDFKKAIESIHTNIYSIISN